MDIAKLREETPLCRNVIHFNNAGASPMPQPVYERFVTYLHREREIGGYEAQAEYQPEIEGAYRRLADLIAAWPSELALVGSASPAFQFGLSALSLTLPACRPAVAWSTSSDLLGARYGTTLNAA